MTNIIGEYVEFIYCACNCGKTRSKYIICEGKVRKDRPVFFISGHNNPKGHKKSEETKKRISKGKKGKCLGEEASGWRGDNVGYSGLHNRIKKQLPKTEFCEICNKVPPHDLANKSGKYLLDKNDWLWLCKRCHSIYDGYIYNLKYVKNYQYEDISLSKIFWNKSK